MESNGQSRAARRKSPPASVLAVAAAVAVAAGLAAAGGNAALGTIESANAPAPPAEKFKAPKIKHGVLEIEGRNVELHEGHAVFVPAGVDHHLVAYEQLSLLVIFETSGRCTLPPSQAAPSSSGLTATGENAVAGFDW